MEPKELLLPVKDAEGQYTERFQVGFLALMVQRMTGEAGTVLVSYGEVQDADAVVKLAGAPAALDGEIPAYVLVQLKEMHPQDKRTVQGFLDDLKRKYPVSPDLILAIHVNQPTCIDFPKLNVEGFGVQQIYFFGGDDEGEILYGAPVSSWRARVVFWGRHHRKSGRFHYGECYLKTK